MIPIKKRKTKTQAPVCPYCGRRAVLRDAAEIYHGPCHVPGQKLYVCPDYPACDSYVTVNSANLRPNGTMANGQLRSRRIMAHRAFDQIWQRGIMTREEAYRWLQDCTGLSEAQAHIALFSEYRCNELIAASNQVLANYSKDTAKGVA